MSLSALGWLESWRENLCFLMSSCAPQVSVESGAKWMRMNVRRTPVKMGAGACSALTRPCTGVFRPSSREPSASATPLASFAAVLWALLVSYLLEKHSAKGLEPQRWIQPDQCLSPYPPLSFSMGLNLPSCKMDPFGSGLALRVQAAVTDELFIYLLLLIVIIIINRE